MELPEDLRKNLYYLSIASLQKMVRRGQVGAALNIGKIAHKLEPKKLFARLWTILFEDCARDQATLLTFYRWRGNNAKYEDVAPLIKAMASGMHSREAPPLSRAIKGPLNLKEGLWFKQNMPHVLEVKRKWESRKYDAYDPHDFPNGTDWIIELCERGHKYDWEGFCVGTPYLNSVHGLDKDVIISDECEHSEMIDDCLPLVGIDTHTRPGSWLS